MRLDLIARCNLDCGYSSSLTNNYAVLIFSAECMTAVNVSVKDRLAFSISVALGSTVVS